MNLLSTHFTVPVVLAVLSLVAGCSSDAASPGTGGSSSGGSSAGGQSGSSGGSVSVGGSAVGGSATGGGGSAGAGTAGSGAMVGASFATVKGIIMKSCFGNGCHGQEGNPLQMKLDDTLYTTLTTHVTMNCGMLVNKASPADSAIVKLLKGSCNGTERMPFGSCFDGDTPEENAGCVPTADVNAIQSWIASGAPAQ